MDLQHILRIRVDKALHPGATEPGVIEKVAAMASREHGDARQAVGLLARSAQLAQKRGCRISLDLIDQAARDIEKDRYITMIRTAPSQMRAVMAGVLDCAQAAGGKPISSGDAMDAYRAFCGRVGLNALSFRAFKDLLAEMDLYSFIRSRVVSRGRRGRTREIRLDLPEGLVAKIRQTILLSFDLK